MKRLRWGLRKVPGGYAGRIVLGLDDGTARQAVAIATTKQEALHNAATIASMIAKNPMFQAMLPPGTLPILTGVRMLAKYGSTPQAKAALRAISNNAPKAVKHLVHALHFW